MLALGAPGHPAMQDMPADRLDSPCQWNKEAKLHGRRTNYRKRRDFIYETQLQTLQLLLNL